MQLVGFNLLEGEHNGKKFVVKDGYLHLSPTPMRYSVREITALWEIHQLLKLEGYTLKEKLPRFLDHPFLGKIDTGEKD